MAAFSCAAGCYIASQQAFSSSQSGDGGLASWANNTAYFCASEAEAGLPAVLRRWSLVHWHLPVLCAFLPTKATAVFVLFQGTFTRRMRATALSGLVHNEKQRPLMTIMAEPTRKEAKIKIKRGGTHFPFHKQQMPAIPAFYGGISPDNHSAVLLCSGIPQDQRSIPSLIR